MRLFIEPTDVWLFRDGRPFDAESDHRAASLFPPPPSVIQGAIRAAHVAWRGARMDDYVVDGKLPEIEKEIGKAGAMPPFQLRGPFIGERVTKKIETNGIMEEITTWERYLPIPADATRVEGGYRSLTPTSPNQLGVTTNLADGLQYLLWKPDSDSAPLREPSPKEKRTHFAWAKASAVMAYLHAEAKAKETIDLKDARADADLFERESRFGIGIDYDARRPKQGALYEVEFIRVCPNVGIDVEIEKLNWEPAHGLLKLGGEGRMARFEQVAKVEPSETTVGTQFKMYFATPAYFDAGWKPSDDWNKFFGDKPPKLVAVALPRYEARGGFDLFRQGHKPAQRFVPAGSVYYFVGESAPKLKQTNVTNYGAEIGFGQVILGRWNHV
jgi:CRISPR-associated protein Cmr3